MRCFQLALSFAVFMTLAVYGEGVDVVRGEPSTGIVSSANSECLGPPPGAQPLEYRILFSQTRRSSEGSATVNLGERPSGFTVRDRQEIQDEAEYGRIFGRPSGGIDWTAFRILVVQMTTTYKLEKLESAVTLSGIFADADGIYVGLEINQYGPAQGIAQQAEWFSYDRTDLFVLLPARPAKIVHYSCLIGGSRLDVP